MRWMPSKGMLSKFALLPPKVRRIRGHEIPDYSLDPWSERRIFTDIRRGGKIKIITVMKMPNGRIIPVNGRRRYLALERLGLGNNDPIETYCGEYDDSEERWQAYSVPVKQSEPKTPRRARACERGTAFGSMIATEPS